jgi:hypothetical protein
MLVSWEAACFVRRSRKFLKNPKLGLVSASECSLQIFTSRFDLQKLVGSAAAVNGVGKSLLCKSDVLMLVSWEADCFVRKLQVGFRSVLEG